MKYWRIALKTTNLPKFLAYGIYMALREEEYLCEASEVPWDFALGASLASFKHWPFPEGYNRNAYIPYI